MAVETSGNGEGQDGNGGGSDAGGDVQGGGNEQPSLEGPAQIVDFAKGVPPWEGEVFTQLKRK